MKTKRFEMVPIIDKVTEYGYKQFYKGYAEAMKKAYSEAYKALREAEFTDDPLQHFNQLVDDLEQLVSISQEV